MRFIFLISIVLLPSLLTAQVRVDPPDGWIELNTPSELPPETIYLKKVASEDQSIQVSVVAMNPIDTVSGAESVIAGLISGMKKGGFNLETVNDMLVQGFPAKHIVGEFRSDQYEGAYLADTHVIFSDESRVIISVLIDDSRGDRELGANVLDWISVTGSPPILSDRPSSPSATFSIAERVGYYGFWFVVGLAVVVVIRRGIARRKTRKGEQVVPPNA